jgi:hypothetical protein
MNTHSVRLKRALITSLSTGCLSGGYQNFRHAQGQTEDARQVGVGIPVQNAQQLEDRSDGRNFAHAISRAT